MKLSLYRGEQVFELIDALEPLTESQVQRVNDPAHARAFLRGLSREPLNMKTLRDFLAADEPAKPIYQLSDAEVLDQVAARMVARQIGVVRIPQFP